MTFKQFLKENPENVFYNGTYLHYYEAQAVVWGVKGNDVCFASEVEHQYLKSVSINDKSYSIELLLSLGEELNLIIADLELYEYFGLGTALKGKIHPTISIAHFLISLTENGHISKSKTTDLAKKLKSVIDFNYWETSGRMWPNNHIISFYEDPTKELVNKLSDVMKFDKNNTLYEIPTEEDKWKMIKYEEIPEEDSGVKAAKFQHVASPIEKEMLRKQLKTNKDRIPKGLGSRKKLPNQPDSKTTAQARAQLSTSEETEK